MTIYDLLTDNLAILRRFHRNGVATQSIRFLPLYEEWLDLVGKGYKKQYVEQVLCDKYGYTPRYIRIIVKFMRDEVV